MRTIIYKTERLNARVAGAYQAHVTAAVHGVQTTINGVTGASREVRACGEINMTPPRVKRVKVGKRMVRRIRFN
ncbi:MAG: hypothetical protein KGL39_32015 [Patescibacteria group bacterium]|nr:hypothetical protein [Patescibacteria group bacterium]